MQRSTNVYQQLPSVLEVHILIPERRHRVEPTAPSVHYGKGVADVRSQAVNQGERVIGGSR